jgi:short-subunit dehydrogenase
MGKTVLITGTSSGIGMETAKIFLDRGWNVIATMRNPGSRKTPLHDIKGITLAHLDVMDHDSITGAMNDAVKKFGTIDVLVNNAGFAAVGPFEASNVSDIKKQFDTNVFGLMETIRCILPIFRGQAKGTIVNVASIAGRIGFPLYSLYVSSKWAVDGFSESLQYELRPFNIRVKIIEPGPVRTNFFDSSQVVLKKEGLDVYDAYAGKSTGAAQWFGTMGCNPSRVAQKIYRAANSNSWKLRYPVADFRLMLARRLAPDAVLRSGMRLFLRS